MNHHDPPGNARLVVGVGASRGVAYAEIDETLRAALARAGLSAADVATVATVSAKRDEPAVRALADRWGADLLDFPAETLAAVDVPHPSPVVRATAGTASVAEAAAITATRGGELLIAKTRSRRRPSMCTIAVARHRVGGNPT